MAFLNPQLKHAKVEQKQKFKPSATYEDAARQLWTANIENEHPDVDEVVWHVLFAKKLHYEVTELALQILNGTIAVPNDILMQFTDMMELYFESKNN